MNGDKTLNSDSNVSQAGSEVVTIDNESTNHEENEEETEKDSVISGKTDQLDTSEGQNGSKPTSPDCEPLVSSDGGSEVSNPPVEDNEEHADIVSPGGESVSGIGHKAACSEPVPEDARTSAECKEMPNEDNQSNRTGESTAENTPVRSIKDEETESTKSDSSDIIPSSTDSSRKSYSGRNGVARDTVIYENVSDDDFGTDNQYDSSDSFLNHPVYKSLVQELASYKEQLGLCHVEIDRLETENQRLEAEKSHEIYIVQLEALEKTISQQQKTIQTLTEEKKHLEETTAKSYQELKQDLESKLQKLSKMYEGANREKEAMVIRYATSERDVIEGKKQRDNLDKKLREAVKEREILVSKVKAMNGEKARICLILDGKCNELTEVQKENEKLKEELNLREVKLKWTQNKLKIETEGHKEVREKLESQNLKMQSFKDEIESVRRESQEMVRAYQESQENRAYTLDKQLKEQQAQLIMERHEKEDKEGVRKILLQEVENFKSKHKVIIEENNLLSVKVQRLEKERLEYEKNLASQKRVVDDQRQNMADLSAKLTQMESLRLQLQHEQERVLAVQGEVERLRQSNAELQQEMAACREREAELLAFTQRLTDKNVWLQSEFSATEAKAQQLESEQEPLRKQLSELEQELKNVKKSLEAEHQEREEESKLLARHLAEKTKRVEQLERDLEDAKGDLNVLRRRQAMTVKELTKELQQCHRRLEMANAAAAGGQGGAEGGSACGNNNFTQPSSPTESNALVPSSRTSSQSSLEARNPHESMSVHHDREQQRQGRGNSMEPSRQVLIERLVELQRNNARKTEKLDFLSDHVEQLLEEIQKKSRIIQMYIMREESGALSSNSMEMNKAELSKHGGIMASVYGSKPLDENMTLEMSLEINRKFQTVLEDTLLKNITLKENIDTLGREIARLTMNNRKS
ncbi:coiled-coil domain-containing protein 186-like isoform X2 [Ischnura elegans]|uniref:coiled-coil domain-containing protein 186-like isoform X2 n=1 Tax=Ischnura elegans TaxID=197161 RepID=UPI001ED8B58F|nr:coiled-coil domain-containing protein 186-like isoform X2 [Ischnura elegans]